MAAEWFYTKQGQQQRQGPVSREQLKQLAAEGALRPGDLVWTVGMPQWSAASSVAGLFNGESVTAATALASAAAPVAMTTAASPIGYYSGPGALPERPAAALRGHAPPQGDVGTWPLDDTHVARWERAVAIRKKINGAAQLYRALLLLTIIGGTVVGMIALFSLMATSARTRAEAWPMLIAFGFLAGFGALYFFAGRATYRSQRWAPLTMFVIFMVAVALNLLGAVMTLADSNARASEITAAMAGVVLGMILPVIFAVVSWRAFAAIPDYLMQPAWCQELIVKAKL